MAEEIYLTLYGPMVERHWREFLPAMVREMEAKGSLMEALFDAQEMTIEEMKKTLTRRMDVTETNSPAGAQFLGRLVEPCVLLRV